jgi:hypothetical protein
MENSFINELLIGTGSKDRFSMDETEKRFAVSELHFRSLAGALH